MPKGKVSLYHWFGLVCFANKTKIVSSHTADSKPVKQEVNGTVILPPLVFPGSTNLQVDQLWLDQIKRLLTLSADRFQDDCVCRRTPRTAQRRRALHRLRRPLRRRHFGM
jgi:hypothetical protein